VKGKCICKESFSGNDCSIDKNEKYTYSLKKLSKPKSKWYRELNNSNEFMSFAQINETILPKNKNDSLISNKHHLHSNNSLWTRISMAMVNLS
jgi:hypothetical protein